MIKFLGILLIAGAITLIEVPELKRKNQKKEQVVFFILLGFAVVISTAFSMGKTIPNPMDLISFIFRPISDVISQWLK